MYAMASWKKLFEREYTVQYWENVLHMISLETSTYARYPVEDLIVYKYEKRNAGAYALLSEFTKHQKILLNYFLDQRNSRKFLNEFMEFGKKYVKTAKKIGQKAKTGDLVELYNNYIDTWTKYTAQLWLTFELNDLFADKLGDFIEQRYNKIKPSESLARILSRCLRPNKVAATVQVGIDAIELKKNYDETALEGFRKKYAWFPCLDLKYSPLTTEEAKRIIETTMPVEKIHKHLDIAKTLKLTSEEADFVDLSQTYFYVKDLRDEYRRKGTYYARTLYQEISRELGIAYSQTYSLLRNEIVNGLKNGKVNEIEATKRISDNYFLYRKDGKTTCVSGKEADAKAESMGIKATETTIHPSNFKGIAASKGIACGKVRKIKVAAHLHRVQQGEILVAITTSPNYINAMNLAGAIVTDEGGLTSHAAIVSRELKKPCIVGTKIATRVLNDGDVIEVNGETGEVKIIQ